MTEKELRSMNTAFGIDFIIDKLPIYPKFTKEQIIFEADFFIGNLGSGNDNVFADIKKRVVQKYPDAKVYAHFKGDYYPISNIDDIINIPGLLNHLELRFDCIECDEEAKESIGNNYGTSIKYENQ